MDASQRERVSQSQKTGPDGVVGQVKRWRRSSAPEGAASFLKTQTNLRTDDLGSYAIYSTVQNYRLASLRHRGVIPAVSKLGF